MIDLETLGLRTDAVILSVGVVPFTFEDAPDFQNLCADGHYFKLSVRDQIELGRTIDDSTAEWWQNQGKDAARVLKRSADDLHPEHFIEDFAKVFSTKNGYNPKESWIISRGNVFDLGKLYTLHEAYDGDVPWHGKRERDIRSFFDALVGTTDGIVHPTSETPGFIHHNSLHDAAVDVVALLDTFERLSSE